MLWDKKENGKIPGLLYTSLLKMPYIGAVKIDGQ